MKIVFFASGCEDYLSDSVLHGLRSLLGSNVVDFPKAERMYRGCPGEVLRRVHGGAMTLYGLLEDIGISRHDVSGRIERGEFDFVIFGDIYRDFGAFVQLVRRLDPRRTALLDGADVESMYPYAGKWWRSPRHWFLPRANRFLYFKRELTPRTLRYRSFLALPGWAAARLVPAWNLRPIAFSIPAEKVVAERPAKLKLFAAHVVDPEVAARVPGSSPAAPFSSETQYYEDLRQSRFGVTTKRSGWDCLRHYELAANACVPCFRDLDRKPSSCAPHGLDSSNCIVYRDYGDLMRQIRAVTDTRYEQLQVAALEWARANTTVERARQLLRAIEPEAALHPALAGAGGSAGNCERSGAVFAQRAK
jgi:hypothetical protein